MSVPKQSADIRPILLVEDNAMDVDLTVQAFADNNVTRAINVCRDGERALDYIGQHQTPDDPLFPAIMLLDLRMPKVSGFEVVRAARADASWRHVPIVVLTTSKQESDVTEAYECGANSYLVKPVDSCDFSKLIKVIESYWLDANRAPYTTDMGRI